MEFKNNINKMMLVVAVVAMSMTMISCSDNDDNPVVPPVEPDDTKEYVIEVEKGMTMPENKFLKVPPTTDCDQTIVNALKAIDKVTDVKAFKLNTRYDYYNEEMVSKTAYFFNYKQDIDHNDPSKGWFKQQCVLTVAGKDRPTVLHTEGYALGDYDNNLQEIGEPALVSVLEANCLQVEYRYFGWSLPEGYTNKWNYLDAKQQSDDLHAIVTAIKQSGVVGNGKWLATGVSKNGMTTAHYAYYYPNEMDAYVPFCAPFLIGLQDIRPYSFILSKEAFDEDTEKLEKVKAAFINFFSDKELQSECADLYVWNHPSMDFSSTEEAILYVKLDMLANYYPKMSYIAYDRWESMIPKAGDSARKYYNFIVSDENVCYPGETEELYYRRKELINDLKPDSTSWLRPYALTRGIGEIKRHFPYYVQLCKELGNYGFDLSWVEHLLTPEEKYFITLPMNPVTYGVTYDDGKFTKEFLEGMKQSTCNMLFVYGMQDPWTGGQIPDDKMGVNCKKLFIQNGTHNDFIDMWNQSEKSELFKWLYSLGFDNM